MTRYLSFLIFVSLTAGFVRAQDDAARHNLELSAAGVFPVTGYKANEYSAGPGLRAGYEVRLAKYLAADAGWTGAWLQGAACSRFGCTYPREELQFVDYGLRGIVPLAAGKVELSAGVGGGYIWFGSVLEDNQFNRGLLQYSGQATVAIPHTRRWRLAFSVRTWRDLGRPTQVWLSSDVGVVFGFGGRP